MRIGGRPITSYGAVFDNPDLIAACVVGDGEAETGPLFCGYGYKPWFVEGDQPAAMHQLMAATLDEVLGEIQRIENTSRDGGFKERPIWPMIILRSPKGWTGPKTVDGCGQDMPEIRDWQWHMGSKAEGKRRKAKVASETT